MMLQILLIEAAPIASDDDVDDDAGGHHFPLDISHGCARQLSAGGVDCTPPRNLACGRSGSIARVTLWCDGALDL